MLTHVAEDAALLLPEFAGAAKLGDGTLAEDEDLVKVSNGAQTMGDDKQGAVVKLLSDAALDQGVGRHVDSRRSLVQDHDLGAADNGAGDAEELALALGQVATGLGDAAVEVAEDVGVVGRDGGIR